jgi:GT2 family glycosyltransferase
VRRQVIENVGPIDERFFIYWEETEWCVRAGNAGWRILNVPRAKVWHKGVQRDYRPKPTVTYYSTRNRLLMLSTHHAPAAAWITALVQIFRTLTSWTLRPKWRGMHEHRNAMWRGLEDFVRGRWGAMPS